MSENTPDTSTRVLGLALAPRVQLQDWPVWWSGLSLPRKFLPGAAVSLYWCALVASGSFKSDHLLLGGAILVLSYGGRLARHLLAFVLPLLLTGIVYDSLRFIGPRLRGPIHVREPYDFDKAFFGIPGPNGTVLTPNEWWAERTHVVLDLVTGFFYLTFIAIFVGIAAYFFFVRRPPKAGRMMWAFFWLNVIGYATYYLYPAAPPWYASLYGFGPVNLDAPPYAAGCLRFDELLGVHVFADMYAKSANIFGAIPSLHVSYPLLAVYYSFRFKALRAFSLFYWIMVSFSAIYLDHHYVLDVLWGWSYAILIGVAVDAWYARRDEG